MESTAAFFSIDGFMPHGHCFFWLPELLWTLVISDAVIVVSYYAIPLIFLYLIRNRLRHANKEIKLIISMFGLFILACGTTHLVSIIVIWHPDYWLAAIAKTITAAISLMTAILLMPIIRKADTYVLDQEISKDNLVSLNRELNQIIDDIDAQKRDLTILSDMSDYLQACETIEEISHTLNSTLTQLWPNTGGALYLLSKEQSEYHKLNEWGISNLADGISSNNCWSHRLSKPFPEASSLESIHCQSMNCSVDTKHYCFPIISGGESLALLHVIGIDIKERTHDQDLILIICERLGLAIHNIQLKQHLEYESTRDGLTGLCNRQYLEQSLKTEIHRTIRNKQDLSIAFIDIDFFKRINDTHGHDIGDQVLRKFSEQLSNHMRSGDVACRYGGEEFVAVFPSTDSEQTEKVLQRLASDLKDEFAGGSNTIPEVTFSAGIAQYPDHGNNYDTLIKLADRALYKAKETGRNSIVLADAL